MTTSEVWYETYREQWRPEKVRLLLIGESAPDPRASDRRFFYAPTLTRYDHLFRGVAAALYPEIPLVTGMPKRPIHERMRADGIYLIDLVPYPVNALSAGERRRALREHVPACADLAQRLDPQHVVICHTPTFRALAPELRARGHPLSHDRPIPFPLPNWRRDFVKGVRAALSRG